MKIYTNKIPNYIINVLTVFLLFSFTSLNMVTWGRYAFLAISFAIFLISSSKYCGGVKFTVKPFHVFLFIFACYCALTALWSQAPQRAITKATTLFYILISFSLIYCHFQKYNSITTLLVILKWSGYFLVFFTFMAFGFEGILKAAEAERLGSAFTNTNTIAMAAAIACVIQIWELIEKGISLNALFLIPPIMIVAATQSRKAFLIIIIGLFVIVFLKNIDNKKFYMTVLKFIISMVIFISAFLLLSKIPIFAGLTERIYTMIEGFKGGKDADHSTLIRLKMIEIGMIEFKKHPVLGIGMDNILIIIKAKLGTKSYSHNNFVDLLSGGGIIGFIIYYAMYIYFLYNLFKYRNIDKRMFRISVSLIFSMLITDYGNVSYYDKLQWFYIMILFINIDFLKRSASIHGNNVYKDFKSS